MIPETRFTLIKVFSVSFGLNIPASTTLARSDIKTKSKQDPKARILYKIGLSFLLTSCGLAVPSTCTAAADFFFIKEVQLEVIVINFKFLNPLLII